MDQQSNSLFRTYNNYTQFSVQNFLKQQSSINFGDILKIQLQQYNDINEDDFQIFEQAQIIINDEYENKQDLQTNQTNYLHQYSNIIPIGTNYQACIPNLIPQQYYRIRSKQMMKKLNLLKIHDPHNIKQFITQYQQKIVENFSQFQLSQQDYMMIFNNFKQYNYEKNVQFDRYIGKTKILWDKYFRMKQKTQQMKCIKKKRKKQRKYTHLKYYGKYQQRRQTNKLQRPIIKIKQKIKLIN